jgi:chromosome segregation protein
MTKRLDKIVFQYKENIMKQDMLKDNFLEKYGKNIEDLYSDELVEEIDENELDMEIRRSREKLNNMGPVNLLAIDEYEEVRSRFEFLDQNRQDMENAKEDLQNLIHEVYSQATESFTEAFNQIEKNLEVVFKKAFGGGKCHLKLEDPKAPLESGIEIIAQPPGKKLQSIALLSGGERTMVAMSIMFAIFMTKPSPFCLLDEVDAALDEANIERFANIINEFSHNTQFIIITHNRITAQRGDIFYGVTMQEPGITKVFSFKPDNLDNENIA